METGAEALDLSPLAAKLGQLGFTVLLSIRDFEPRPARLARLPRCLPQLAPLDSPWIVARFLDHWRPNIVLLCGPKIAPNLVIEASLRKIPIALVNASLSGRSSTIWPKFPGLAQSLLQLIDVCLAQTNSDAERFKELGMRKAEAAGNLKYDFLPEPADQSALAHLLARIGKRPAPRW